MAIRLLCFGRIQTNAEELLPVSDFSIYSIYDAELETSIIGGSGTDSDPYIVDYTNAPHFEEYVLSSLYQQSQGDASVQVYANGFTGLMLTQFYGYNLNGGVWVYSYVGSLLPPMETFASFKFHTIPTFKLKESKPSSTTIRHGYMPLTKSNRY